MNNKNAERMKPRVSVLMPAYNAEEYVEAAVRSVMAQTFGDWEMIIIDDHSQDSTYWILCAIAREDKRIRVYRNPENLGAARTRNRGLDLCRGSYIALLDCDDVWYPAKLERQLKLAEQESADIVYCSYAIIDGLGKKRCNDFIVPAETDFDASLVKSVISCSTALLSRNVVDHYRFPLGYYHEDLAMWLQLLGAGMKAAGVREVLAEYRVRTDSRASNKIEVAKNRWKIYRDYLKLPFWKSAWVFCNYAVCGLRKYMDVYE